MASEEARLAKNSIPLPPPVAAASARGGATQPEEPPRHTADAALVQDEAVAETACFECGEGPDTYPRPAVLYFNSPGDLNFYCADCWKAYYGTDPPASAQAFGRHGKSGAGGRGNPRR